MGKYVLALDQGTTSSRAVLFDHDGRIAATAQKEFAQIYPRPGWVEHDPSEIWATQAGVALEAQERAGVSAREVAAIGITNQRETTVVWDKRTGLPVGNAIVWQCRRTAAMTDELKARGLGDHIRRTTGLIADAYFSATKLAWILDNTPAARRRAEDGELLFGTVDSWLLWKMTGGKVHGTDPSNAARTMLFNIHTGDWDDRLLGELGIPRAMLPKVLPSSGIFGETAAASMGLAVPVAGIAGDQQAALFGQCCFDAGEAKATYGTGAFILLNTGRRALDSHQRLLTTIAWKCGAEAATEYALEGSVYNAGSAVQWLRDEMRLIVTATETEEVAKSVADSAGVYMVPAFTGLGAPYWDMYARGTIVGLTRGAGRAHLVRAVLESIAYQTRDVLDAMRADGAADLKQLNVDGGAAANNFLLQFQADILGVPVARPKVTETTALGAAMLAGLAVGFWKDRSELKRTKELDRVFEPSMDDKTRARLWTGWKKAVRRSCNWADE